MIEAERRAEIAARRRFPWVWTVSPVPAVVSAYVEQGPIRVAFELSARLAGLQWSQVFDFFNLCGCARR